MTTVEPASVDVSGFDLVVFGSPVWAFKPTPAIHAAIDALKGCQGKNATAFCTHGGRPGQMDETFRKWIEARGMILSAVADINMKDIENENQAKANAAYIVLAVNAYDSLKKTNEELSP